MVLEVSEDVNVLRIGELGEADGVGHIESVDLLGYAGEVRWAQDKNNLRWSTLRIMLPDDLPDSPAYAFRVSFQ